jgi:hypothetical protein
MFRWNYNSNFNRYSNWWNYYWYDAATAGNAVTTPTQVGVGTKLYYTNF